MFASLCLSAVWCLCPRGFADMPLPDARVIVNRAANQAWTPPSSQSIADWADENRFLAADSPERGNYRTARTPYARQIMECLSPFHPARHVVWEKGVQLGATTVGLNWIGYIAAQNPAPTIITLPSEGVAKEWSNQRLTQLVEDTPCLRGKILDAKRRGSGNTIYLKRIAGTSVTIKIAWSSSAKKLRSTPAANLLSDEVDGFENDPEGEGSVLVLLDGRFVNFPRGKHFMISTPTRVPSKIHAEFLKGDQRFYFVPCPFCGRHQSLDDPERKRGFHSLKWADGFLGFECVGCQQRFQERFKTQFLSRGLWVATRDASELLRDGFDDPHILAPILSRMEQEKFVTFHLSAMYSPIGWYSWDTLREDWQRAQSNPTDLKAIINTKLAEVWREPGEDPPDAEKLMARREDSYRLGEVPAGVLFLTAGVDTQASWLEGYVWGWGRNRHRWLVDHWRFDGDPLNAPAWDWLTQKLNEVYTASNGVQMSLSKLAIDTGYAAHTQQVYSFARQHGAERVLAVDGRSAGELVGYPSLVDVEVRGKKISNGAKLWPINVSKCKSELYGLLNRERPKPGEPLPPGWVHFPIDADEQFFWQLTSERFVFKSSSGKGYWEKDGGVRNEALDCYDYARGAASLEGFDRATDDDWDYLARKIGAPCAPATVRNGEPLAAPRLKEAMGPASTSPPSAARQRAPSNFMRELLG